MCEWGGGASRARERGFTLVELLVTMVVLGVLSGVTVVAVGGIRQQGQAGACAADRAALETAMEAYNARSGAYGTEADLVAAGQLRDESSMYDVTLGAGDYELTAIGPCADAGEGVEAAGADADTDTTTTTALTTPPAPPPTDAPTTTTTVAPTTTTTTAPVVALRLSGPCTPRSHWPGERAWEISNRNAVAVAFVLDAVNASDRAGHRIDGEAPPGSSTWYLPAANRGRNTAVLEAAGAPTSRNSNNRRC